MAELVALTRPVFRSFLISQVRIQRPSYTSDGGTGTVLTYTDVAQVAGRVRPWQERRIVEDTIGGQIAVPEFNHVLYIEAPQDVRAGDRVIFADREGPTFRVVDVLEPSYAEFHLEVRMVVEVPDA